MFRRHMLVALLGLAVVGPAPVVVAGLFPLTVSADGRRLLDGEGRPFLYHADTAWMLPLRLTLEEADAYFATRKSQGFNAVQVMLTGFHGMTNRAGERPFFEDDFDRRNERYFSHFDELMKRAERHGLLLSVAPLWAGCCREGWAGKDEQGAWLPLDANGPVKCRELGRYLGRRYSQFLNLLWILGGDNDPHESREVIEQLALGLHETGPEQLRTYHASSSRSSTDHWPAAEWLEVSMVYTYFRGFNKAWTQAMPDVYEVSWSEWTRTPVRPFFLGESTYEGEHDDWGSPLQVRKQAYWAVLGGATGHAYGSPNWRCEDGWRAGLQRPGALSLRHWQALFESRPWWQLVPDLDRQFLTAGAGPWATNDLATAALTSDRRLAMVYLPSRRNVTVDLKLLTPRRLQAWWFNPREGGATPAGEWKRKRKEVFPVAALEPPAEGDWVLVVEDAEADWGGRPGE